jgi:sugar lactone lactonase YvrE
MLENGGILGAAAIAAIATTACGSGEGDPCDPDAPGTICTIVGTGLAGYGGDDGPALDARVNVPQDMVVAEDGKLWVLDFNNYMVRTVDPVDGTITTVLGTGLLGDDPDPGVEEIPAIEASFNHTTDLFFHDGYLYMAAWHQSRIKRMDLATGMLSNYAGTGRRTLFTGDGGPALAAAVDLPSAIALDPDGNITIMDQANQVIRRIDYATNVIDTIVGTCVIDDVVQCEEGQAPVACNTLEDFATSNKTTCGDPATECGKPCTPNSPSRTDLGTGGDGGLALDARLSQPFGQMAAPAGRIVYDPEGNLYFSDTSTHRIRKVDTEGIITTIAGTGQLGSDGEGVPATEATFAFPVDLEIADDGTLYVADSENNCIRKIDPAGDIHTVAGVCSHDPAASGFGGDGGDPLEATLNWPYGIELDGDKLYVADSYNNRNRVVNL